MGCCASRSNGVSPSDTPKKRPISGTPHSLVTNKFQNCSNHDSWCIQVASMINYKIVFSWTQAFLAGFPWEADNSECKDPSRCKQQQKQKNHWEQCKTTKTSFETWEVRTDLYIWLFWNFHVSNLLKMQPKHLRLQRNLRYVGWSWFCSAILVNVSVIIRQTSLTCLIVDEQKVVKQFRQVVPWRSNINSIVAVCYNVHICWCKV